MRKRLWHIAAVCLLWLGCVACGSGSDAPGLGMKLQLLNSTEIKSIRFLDMAIFDGSKIDCDQITPTNYLSDVEPIKSARKQPIVGSNDPVVALDVKDGKPALADKLIDGDNLVLFVLALTLSSDNEKKKFASGCISRVNLIKGKSTEVPITLSAIK